MRNNRIMIFIAALLVFTVLPVLAQQIMSVQVQGAQLRQSPSFLGKTTATLDYGARVMVLGEQGDFMRVVDQATSASGWLHASALTEKQIMLSGSGSTAASSATSDEIALAGKGFNKQVEESYRSQTGLDYSQVDYMETLVVSEPEKAAFLAEGQVTPGGGN